MTYIPNIQGHRITGSLSGITSISATSLYGDGSNLTGIQPQNTYYISNSGGDFTTIQSAVTFVNSLTGTSGVYLKVDAGDFNITDTVTINSTRPMFIEGMGVNVTNINPTTGMAGKPMFNIYTSANFTKFKTESSGLTGYGTATTENFINYYGNSKEFEITDTQINGYYNGLNLIGTSSLFAFNFVFNKINNSAIIINSTGTTQLDIEVGSFYNCKIGINLEKSNKGIFDIHTNFFYPATSGQTGITYNSTNYLYDDHPSIQGNKWNNIGTFISGFDFTRVDGRDKNIVIQNNIGVENKLPHAYLNLVNNGTEQTLAANTWTKLNFSATTFYTCKVTIDANNRMTYQPSNTRDVMLWCSGAIQTTSQPCILELSLVRNGNIFYAPVSLTLDTNSRKFTWSANGYVPDMSTNEYIEIWGRTVGSETIIFEDFCWMIKAM